MDPNLVTKAVLNSAFKVHTVLGPGLLETVYERALAYELESRGHRVRLQVPIAVVYEDIKLEDGFRVDMIVDDVVLVELKSQEILNPVTYKIVLSYLRFSGLHVALLINFGTEHLKDGIKRIVNRLPEGATSQ